MKNLLLLILSTNFFLITSCEDINTNEASTTEQNEQALFHKIHKGDMEIVIIEDCEYIAIMDYRGTHGFGYFAHKGNCSNPIHCHNQNTTLDSTIDL